MTSLVSSNIMLCLFGQSTQAASERSHQFSVMASDLMQHERGLFDRFLRRAAQPFVGKGLGDLPILRTIARRLRDPRNVEFVLVEGRKLYLNPSDLEVSATLALRGYYEPIETELLKEYVQPGMRILDVGANIGYFTVLTSSLVGETGHVYAIEPDETNFDYLSRSIAELPAANVSLVKAAAWSSNCELDLFLSESNPGDHRTWNDDESETEGGAHYSVAARRIDDIVPRDERIDVVKMDIQGAEGHALLGMSEMLETRPPALMILEFWPHALQRAGTEPREVFELLRRSGYQVVMRGIGREEHLREVVEDYEQIARYCSEEWKFANLVCGR